MYKTSGWVSSGERGEVHAIVGTDQMVPGSVILLDGWLSEIDDTEDAHVRPQRRSDHPVWSESSQSLVAHYCSSTVHEERLV